MDRLDRRRILLVCDIGRCLTYGALPLWWWAFGHQVGVIYAVALVAASLSNLFKVTHATAIPNLVSASQIMAANGQFQSPSAIAFLLGPPLAEIIAVGAGPVTGFPRSR